MQHPSPTEKWDVSIRESITVFDGAEPRHYRIYNRGPGSISVHDRQSKELATLVAHNCLDFVGDHFTIHADGVKTARVLCEPINPAARQNYPD